MKYVKFLIKNFKGIKDVELDLTQDRILTLVGLNESGKTTILEAIKLFHRLAFENFSPTETDLNSYRPKGIAFTGTLQIKAELLLEPEDLKNLEHLVASKGRNRVDFPTFFAYDYRFHFKTHKYDKNECLCIFNVTTARAKKKLYITNNQLWQELIVRVRSRVPEILMYDEFNFDIKEKITFQKGAQPSTNSGLQLMLNDVIKTVNPKLASFQEYVVNIWDSDEDTARNRVSSMEQKLNEKITHAWIELFRANKGVKDVGHEIGFKEIKLLCNSSENCLELTFKIKTASGKEFSINERSKGFRWFFSFLIFTEFRKRRTRNILFLLDEPASNLHPSAQKKILEAIKQLSDGSMVIYSTHSHHLINPDWLSGAYIVLNNMMSAAQLEGDITDEEGGKITAEKYYAHVSATKGSKNSMYFQPILDRLDYKPSLLEPTPSIVITEGKHDWYVFKYFSEIILENKYKFNFYPGLGCDNQWDIIRLYLSWGKSFLVILDGDRAGKQAKINYIDKFNGFVSNRIYSFEDALGVSCELEGLFEEVDKQSLINSAFGEGSSIAELSASQIKTKLHMAINKLFFERQKATLSPQTVDRFQKLFGFIQEKFCPEQVA